MHFEANPSVLISTPAGVGEVLHLQLLHVLASDPRFEPINAGVGYRALSSHKSRHPQQHIVSVMLEPQPERAAIFTETLLFGTHQVFKLILCPPDATAENIRAGRVGPDYRFEFEISKFPLPFTNIQHMAKRLAGFIYLYMIGAVIDEEDFEPIDGFAMFHLSNYPNLGKE